MLLCRFDEDRLGLVEGDFVRDVTCTVNRFDPVPWPAPPGDPVVANLGRIRSAVGSVSSAPKRAIADVALNCVITAPTKIMAAPANYRDHVAVDAQDPGIDHGVHARQLQGLEHPVESLGLFLKATSSLAGPADGIRINRPDRRTDYEVELVVILGRTARNVAAADALSYVAGYCVGLDMSVRGIEDRSFRKSADTFTVLGPWLTTAEEIADPGALTLWLSLNGVERQRCSTAEMTVGIPRLIELASAAYTLYPGDVLMTGTPAGVGAVVPGDTIVAGCDGLGQMTVRVSSC
jgi:2,4-didehydro-3-deoxy-L-rhamnonate hydrolase